MVTMRKSTGSDIVNLARNRWGIFHHMVNDLPVFEDPRTKMHFHSKNYVSFEMPEGFSVYEYLGLPFPSLPKITHIINPGTGMSTRPSLYPYNVSSDGDAI